MSAPSSSQHGSCLGGKAHLEASPLGGTGRNRTINQCSRFSGAAPEIDCSLAWLKAPLWLPGGHWEQKRAQGIVAAPENLQYLGQTSDKARDDNLLEKKLGWGMRGWGDWGGGGNTHKYRDYTIPQKVWESPAGTIGEITPQYKPVCKDM